MTGQDLPRVITADEVRAGDMLEVAGRGVVVTGRTRADFDGVLQLGDNLVLGSPGYVITLIERPLSPIPTEPGTIIRRKPQDSTDLWPTLYRLQKSGEWIAILGGCLRETPTREDYDVLVPEVLS